jgi:hypothetical protein
VLCLVLTHLLNDCSATMVFFRQGFLMGLQMGDHSVLGGMDKAQADPIPKQPGNRAHGKRRAIKNGIENAGTGVKLTQALFAPGEVILFLSRRVPQRPTNVGGLRDERLTLIKGLRTNLPRMIHAHQPSRMPASVVIKMRGRERFRRGRPVGGNRPRHRPQ